MRLRRAATITRPTFPLVRRVVRGGVEPPTFRFSGAGNTVSARSFPSFTVRSGLSPPLIDSDALR